jgi:hypothetical protein
MWVYVNCPNPHFTVHRDPACRMIQLHGKVNQRVRRVTSDTLGGLLSELIDRRMRFAAQKGLNDLWLEVNLDTPEQEMGLVHIGQAILGRRYRSLATAPVKKHC